MRRSAGALGEGPGGGAGFGGAGGRAGAAFGRVTKYSTIPRIATPMIAGPNDQAALAELAATVPLGRTGITADVVEVVIHLASDKSS